ncbi:PEP-CTERM sorting domain-containing protein [Nostoc sp. MS1]|uniref:PEP-CTERM sorting domain-containing protein n=1 Tax=Nostoc sp. MS1 TaxID=2764711 RepID=UPI001CC69305|nr:PEP-CTERM sorting domain-containing protein [Nostoc sp. MS1]BCL36873.1 hypothetical protein NSMS1_33200 [Nostoc sp. MS1]
MNVISKTSFFKRAIATFASLPVAASVSICTDNAQAAVLQGEFILYPGYTIGFGSSNATLTKNFLSFAPKPITPVNIIVQTGNFLRFNTGNITNNITFGTLVGHESLFLDLGSIPGGDVISPNTDTSSLTDRKNTFNLTNSTYRLIPSLTSTVVEVSLSGFFKGDNSDETTNGFGLLTFVIGNKTIFDVQQVLATDGSISDLNFTGIVFTSVCGDCGTIPEPATIFGLGLVAGVMAVSRCVKNSA